MWDSVINRKMTISPGTRRAARDPAAAGFDGPGELVLERPVQRDDMLSGVLSSSAQARPGVAVACLDGLDSFAGELLLDYRGTGGRLNLCVVPLPDRLESFSQSMRIRSRYFIGITLK
jgi:hypothetical protein